MVTKKIKMELKRQAKQALKENGIKLNMKDMELLELGYEEKELYGVTFVKASYIMVEDSITGKQFQCYYGHYNEKTGSLWEVEEYIY